ncbi:DUF4347 domain-containing protein, partial [Azospirillum sp. ST 5-10]
MHEILIADSGLDDLGYLLERLRGDVRVVLVDGGEDAHAALAAALAERPAAVHLLAHGEPGRIHIGADPIDADSLLDRHWPAAPKTEVLIHACRVAEGGDGQDFLKRLAYATGASVAAASRPVGHAALGGSWALDSRIGRVRNAGPFAGHEAWPHLLAVTGTPSEGDDTLTSDDGADSVSGLGGNDSLIGGAGNDYLFGNAGNDTLIAGVGRDTLDGGPGADHMEGGSGFDFVSYEQTTGDLVVDLANPGNNAGDAAGDTFSGIEVFVLGNQNDTFVGSDGADWVWAHNGDDIEYGGLGNDTLEAGGGNDVQYGEAGDDVIATRADDDTAFGGEGNDLIEGDGGSDVLYGDAGSDSLAGDAEADTLYGGEGDDFLYAAYDERDPDGVQRFFATQNTEDRVAGQADQYYGEGGNDRFVVYDADDVNASMIYDGGDGTDAIEVQTAEAVDFEGMTLTSVEAVDLAGDGTHEVTFTAAQINALQSVTGGDGDVLHIIGSAAEAGDLSGKVSAGIDVQFSIDDGSDTLSGGDGGDTLSGGDGGDTLSGGDGGDTLSGGDGGDTLSGGDGGDTLSGGDGGDTLSGGDGGDTVGGGDGGSGGGSDGGG